jgi:hypothetical protein
MPKELSHLDSSSKGGVDREKKNPTVKRNIPKRKVDNYKV